MRFALTSSLLITLLTSQSSAQTRVFEVPVPVLDSARFELTVATDGEVWLLGRGATSAVLVRTSGTLIRAWVASTDSSFAQRFTAAAGERVTTGAPGLRSLDGLSRLGWERYTRQTGDTYRMFLSSDVRASNGSVLSPVTSQQFAEFMKSMRRALTISDSVVAVRR